MTALREEVARAIQAFVMSCPDDGEQLPAVEFVLGMGDLLADAVIPIILGRAAEKSESIGQQYGEDETGWLDCSETIAAAIRQIGRGE